MMKISKRIISMVLTVSMMASLLSGCSSESTGEIQTETTNESVEVDTEKIVEDVSDEIQNAISTNWEDYKGDVETFIYGLIISQLEYKYDVFPAEVELENGLSVSGIAYTNYEDCYTVDDETYFEAGFISSVGEIEIPQDEFDNGIIIENLDYSDDDTKFIMAYQSDAFTDHCIVYGQYVVYGVDDSGCIFYEEQEYEKGKCNEELGSLYSYDEAKYVYDVDVGDYVYVTGQSLITQLDYDSLQEEVNAVLEEQDENFVQVDVETCVYVAQEAVNNYLLSMQEETFLGYDVKELAELTAQLNPMECYRITSDGLMETNLEHSTEDTVAQWLVGSACVIAVAVGLVGSVVCIECPALSAASGAMAGTAIEIFMQVVIANGKVSDIEWSKVAIAAGAGAVSGFLGPYIMATTAGFSGFMIDSALDGVVGAVEQTLYAWMDGESGTELVKSFGMGFAMGFGLSAGFKGVGAAVGKIAQKLSPSVSKLGEKMFPKLTGKLSNFSKVASSKLYGLKKVADSSVFHSEYISKKLAFKQLEQLVQNGSPELKQKAFANLKKDGITDVNGNAITKESLEEIFDKAQDGEIIGKYVLNGETINIKKQNGMVGIVFDETKYQTVEITDGLVPDREANFERATEKLKEQWLDNPDPIPDSISKAIEESGIELENMDTRRLVSIIQNKDNGWVLHENIDMKTITLVAREVHDSVQGGITHMGGFGLAKYVKTHMGTEFLDRLISAAATDSVVAGEN